MTQWLLPAAIGALFALVVVTAYWLGVAAA